jgi:hypothetical protein
MGHQDRIANTSDGSPSEKTKAVKAIESIKKVMAELDVYERDTLFPLAAKRIGLDLDDGVRINYSKLGPALRKIPGMDKLDSELSIDRAIQGAHC